MKRKSRKQAEEERKDEGSDFAKATSGKRGTRDEEPDLAEATSGIQAPKPEAADKGKQAPEPKPQDDRLLRLMADFENFRKRVVRERNDLYRRANEDILNELLPVMDHLELALKAVDAHEETGEAFVEGVRLVLEQLLAVLAKFGLEPLDAEEQRFDPDLHEAVSHLPSESVREGDVLTQIRRGYRLGDRLLRPAQVVVSSGSASAGAVSEAPDAGEEQAGD